MPKNKFHIRIIERNRSPGEFSLFYFQIQTNMRILIFLKKKYDILWGLGIDLMQEKIWVHKFCETESSIIEEWRRKLSTRSRPVPTPLWKDVAGELILMTSLGGSARYC